MQSHVRSSIFVIFAVVLAGCETNVQPFGPEEAPTRVLMEVGGSAVYMDLGAFLAAAPGVVVEDFEGANTPPGSAVGCDGAFNSSTDNECFSPGAIREGISLRSLYFLDMLVVLRPGVWPGMTGTAVGPTGVDQPAGLTFPGTEVNAVGFTLLAPFGGPGTVLVEAWGTSDELLQSFEAQVGELTGVFNGLVTDAPIARVAITPPEDIGVLFDEIWFGSTAPAGGAEPGGVIVQVEQGAINPRSQGVIPVSVLTTDDFDAARIDPATVRFGPGEAQAHRSSGKISDVDGDGRPDMVLHFSAAAANLSCGDEEATLTGRTLDGVAFEGTAPVRVLCLPAPPGRR
jgi:hypothetical protein